MSYRAAHYNAVFEAMRRQFGEQWYGSVPPMWWNVWRKQIREWFFDEDILIGEMIAGLDEAAGKRRWPAGTSFFRRLHDVVLKNRIERKRRGSVQVDGMKRLGDLFPRT